MTNIIEKILHTLLHFLVLVLYIGRDNTTMPESNFYFYTEK